MSFQQRVFKQKKENFLLDVSVSVVCDFSGSMGGDKIRHAMQSMIILNDCFGKINVPFEMLGFTEGMSAPDHYIFKTFNKKVTNEVLADRLMTARNYNMGGNADGDAIAWSYSRLIKQPTKRKIMLVLSDGSPAGGKDGDIDKYTKDIVKEIENGSPVEIMGIGIQDNNVKRIYKNNQIIDDAGNLEVALINVLKNIILH